MGVLVTGAAGFIGSHLTERLLADGHRVVALDSFDDFYSPAIKERNLAGAREFAGLREVRGDVRDPALLASLPDDIETVVHLAARPGVRSSVERPTEHVVANVQSTVEILDWMRHRQLRTLVFASSSSVYGDRREAPAREDEVVDKPLSPYAAAKRSGELLCHTYHHLAGISTVCLRFFSVYGPRQRPDMAIHKFAMLLREGRPIPVFGDGSSQRDYTFVTDIIEGIVRAVALAEGHPPLFEVINLGSGRAVPLTGMLAELTRQMGVQPVLRHLQPQPGDVNRTLADIAKAGQLLDYAPRTGLETGVAAFLEWLRGQDGG